MIMSLMFKPRIPFNFGAGKYAPVKKNQVDRERLSWSEDQLETLMCLRALRFTLKECGEHFGRSGNACSNIIEYRQLKGLIKQKREELVNKVVKNDS
jgi:hypothetical protein|tara:strand:- start:38 stop:328 length:291 start_codon:yes stop_codon:yes gene_type:complete